MLKNRLLTRAARSSRGVTEPRPSGSGLLAAVAVLLAATSMALAGDPSLVDIAASGDHMEAMRLLGAKGANVNATGADGATAIMYAAANGDLELVRALIKAGADVKMA